MTKLTLDRAVELHRMLWDRISHMCDEEYLRICNYRDTDVKMLAMVDMIADQEIPYTSVLISNHCFLCEYTKGEDGWVDCDKCPLVFERFTPFSDEGCLNGYYVRWARSVKHWDAISAIEYAKLIRDLPIVNRGGDSDERSDP